MFSTLLLILPAAALALWAQWRVKHVFSRYKEVRSSSGATGAEAARRLLDTGGLTGVEIKQADGRLSDHYDPRDKSLSLSQETYGSGSVAALAVAAHEVGHAVQHKKMYTPFRIRSFVFPAARFGSQLSFPLFFAGFLFSTGNLGILMDVGIILFAATVVFHLVTLPVEFDASRRGLAMLSNNGYITKAETGKVKKVLNAAAMTYVAAAAVSVMHLIRLVLLRGVRD